MVHLRVDLQHGEALLLGARGRVEAQGAPVQDLGAVVLKGDPPRDGSALATCLEDGLVELIETDALVRLLRTGLTCGLHAMSEEVADLALSLTRLGEGRVLQRLAEVVVEEQFVQLFKGDFDEDAGERETPRILSPRDLC